MKSLRSSKSSVEKIDNIRPYWRNPRNIPDEAVEAVRKSIEEFGYVQPIVVDSKNVIIIGHTRYIAMRRMGVDSIDVIKATDLTDRQAKELRIIDNRSSEFSSWDYTKLLEEVQKSESSFLSDLFPELTASDVLDDGGWEIAAEGATTSDKTLEFICPQCFHEWEQVVTREQIFDGKVMQS